MKKTYTKIHKKGEQWIVKIPFMFSIPAELYNDCKEDEEGNEEGLCFLKLNKKKFEKIMNENKKQFDKYMKNQMKQQIIVHRANNIIFKKQVKV